MRVERVACGCGETIRGPPTYPSVVPPLSREYPIGKGFRLLPSSDLQKVIPSHDF
jgi:hypothetical protein